MATRSRLLRTGLLAAVMTAALGGTAQAVHWPFFGGDNGRSGYQPIDEGTGPVPFIYSKTGADAPIKTSIVTTTGTPATQRLAYGTVNGNVHLQTLADGAPVGPEAGSDIDEGTSDTDVFGTHDASLVPTGTNASSVSFADTSGAAGLGQLYAVHNDDDPAAGAADIEVARFNESTGALVDQVDVAATDGFTIDSSPVATGPAADGTRSLFFVARNGAVQALFKVRIAADGSVDGASAVNSGDIDVTPGTSPTLLFIPDAGNAPVAHVAVGRSDGILQTFPVAGTLTVPGPVSPPLGGPVQTPSVPVQPSGMTPNPAGPVTTAPFVYVAAATAAAGTTVYKLQPTAVALLTVATSNELAGAPAPALATDQEATAGTLEAAKVFVTTGENLYFLSTDALTAAGTFSNAPLTPGSTGFRQTTAAGSGELVFVTNDAGQQFVLRLSDARPVAGFTANAASPGASAEAPVSLTANQGFGQPSISRGFVQFSGPAGAFVYRTTDANPPAVTLTAPAEGATLSGTLLLTANASDTRGIASVTFRLNGRPIATDTTPDSGSPFAPGAGATYSATLATATVPDGFYIVEAVATDASGTASVSAPRRVTIDNRAAAPGAGDDRPPTVAITAPRANALVRGSTQVSARASDDRGVSLVAFSVGDRLVCADRAAPYSCSVPFGGADVGRNSLFAVAVDTSGQTAAAVRTVRLDRFSPRALSARVTPNRDRSFPYRFTTSGRLSLPARVTRAQGCRSGRVSVQVKRVGRRATKALTLSTRRVTLRRDCSYRSTVTFSVRRRIGSGRLAFTARFLGNDVLKRRSAPRRSARAG